MSERTRSTVVFGGPGRKLDVGTIAALRSLNLDFDFFGSNLLLPRNLAQPEKRHSWTYACLKARSTAYASVPLKVMTGTRDEPRAAGDHPLQALMERPNPAMSSSLFWRLHRRNLDLKGYSLILVDPFSAKGQQVKAQQGRIPRELWVQDADDYYAVVKVPGGERRLTPAEGGLIAARPNIVRWEHVSKDWSFQPWQVVYDEMPEGPPARAAQIAMEGDFNAAIYAKGFAENDCNPSGWYEVDELLTPTEREQFNLAAKEKNGGSANAGKHMLLEAGVKWTPNPMTHRDMQFLEGRAYWLDEMSAIYGVPKAILSIGDDAKYSNHLAQMRVFMEATIFPLHRDTEDILWTQLFSQIEGGRYWVVFDPTGLPALQSDIGDRLDNAGKLWGKGFSRNELNARFNLGFDDDEDTGDVRYVAAGILPAELAASTDTGEADVNAPAVGEEKLTPEQVTAILAIVSQVLAGTLPPESAKKALALGYPLTPADIDALIDPAEEEEEPPADNPPPPPPPGDQEAADEAQAAQDGADGSEEPQPEEGDAEPQDGRAILLSAVAAVRGRRERLERARQVRRDAWNSFRDRQVSTRERRFAGRLVKLFYAQKAEIMTQVEAKLRRLAPGKRVDMQLTFDDLADISFNEAKWNATFAQQFTPVYDDMLVATGRYTAAELGGGIVFNAVDPRWIELVNARVADKLVGVNAETVRGVRRSLRSSLLEGLTPREMMERLRVLPEFSRARARLVAVTEMGYTVNQTKAEEFERNQINRIVWVTSGTERVRDSHVECEAAGAINRGETFPNGLRWPHDETGPAEEVCACECGLMAALEGE